MPDSHPDNQPTLLMHRMVKMIMATLLFVIIIVTLNLGKTEVST